MTKKEDLPYRKRLKFGEKNRFILDLMILVYQGKYKLLILRVYVTFDESLRIFHNFVGCQNRQN